MSLGIKDDGGPAFQFGYTPVSLRDWFAGMALQSIIAKHPPRTGFVKDDHEEVSFANGAYAYADAMLAVRKGGES